MPDVRGSRRATVPIGFKPQARARRRFPSDLVCRAAGLDKCASGVAQEIPVAAVAEDKPVVGIVEGKAFRNTLDGINQPLPGLGNLA